MTGLTPHQAGQQIAAPLIGGAAIPGPRTMEWKEELLKIIAKQRSEQNKAAIDPWSVVHLGSGLAFGLMKVPPGWSVAAALAYELAEQFMERADWGKRLFATRGPESPGNAVVDTAAFMVGYWLGTRWVRGK